MVLSRGSLAWWRGRSLRVLASALLVCGWISAARAHNVELDLSLWGHFIAESPCQRTIARAAAQCISQVIAARRGCRLAALRGARCNEAAMNASVVAARTRALDLVEQGCTPVQLNGLGFIDVRDAQNDVINACREFDTTADSAIFGPAMASGGVGSVAEPERSCMDLAGTATTRLLRVAIQAHQRAFDQIAVEDLTLDEKEALLRRAQRRIARAIRPLRQRVLTGCDEARFTDVYGRTIRTFLEGLASRTDCFPDWAYAQRAVKCPPSSCGNGIQEPGEECDDGNDGNGDYCRNDCLISTCESYASTFDLIQEAIFARHSCTNAACHGAPAATAQGGLDLRPGEAYTSLVDAPAQTPGGWKRVDPGNREDSLLWYILAAKTNPAAYGDPTKFGKSPFRNAMPLDPFPAISPDELEALRLWISAGAPRTGTVAGTGDLMNACLPPPEPIAIRPPPPPPPEQGAQIHMPRWELDANREREVCFVSYYDLSHVPAQFRSPDGQRIRFNRVRTTQDPLSHHLVVLPYEGNTQLYPPTHGVWGTYVCAGGPRNGVPCNPLDLAACGAGWECGTVPVVSPGCVGFGPPDARGAFDTFGFAGIQETVAEVRYVQGVYGEIPVRGTMMWNSHAFNATGQRGKLEAWIDLYFAQPDEQRYLVDEIVNINAIFNVSVAPFDAQETCAHHVFQLAPSERAVLFELSAHTHKRGKRFQAFLGRFGCQGGSRHGTACSPTPLYGSMCPGGTCAAADGRDPIQSLVYTNLLYNDALVIRPDPPFVFPGSGALAERTITYCAVYDNGKTAAAEVKRRSTSPQPAFPIGGPCAPSQTRCIGGPKQGTLCSGSNAVCESAPGKGDGDCDACPLTGGITTEDEMFVLLGRYYVQ